MKPIMMPPTAPAPANHVTSDKIPTVISMKDWCMPTEVLVAMRRKISKSTMEVASLKRDSDSRRIDRDSGAPPDKQVSKAVWGLE